MALRWPDGLPLPQVTSLSTAGPDYAAIVDVLAGPTRARVDARHAQAGYEFEVWMTADETALFKEWYRDIVKAHDGEWYAPWIGRGQVVAFVNEYQQAPLGTGWRLSGVVAATRIDPALCYEHIIAVFGDLYRDDGVSPDVYYPDAASAEIYWPDYPLELVAQEPC